MNKYNAFLLKSEALRHGICTSQLAIALANALLAVLFALVDDVTELGDFRLQLVNFI